MPMELPDTAIRLVGVVGSLLGLALLALLLRWTYGTQRSNPSPPSSPSELDATDASSVDDDFGLLAEASFASTSAEADVLRAILTEHGIRATIARTDPVGRGYRLLVFSADLAAARVVLSRRRPG